MTSIGILGRRGRMGRAIASAAPELGAVIANAEQDSDATAAEDSTAIARGCEVLVDFTCPLALAEHLEAAVAARRPIVVGTTGLDAGHQVAIDEAAEHIAVLQSANMSLGVNVLNHLVRETARRLGPDWDIEILEMHHRHKLDAPSGTALMFGASAAEGRGSTSAGLNRFDRLTSGRMAREEGTIGYASLRGGSVAGDHMVIFAGEHERLEFGHRAESRQVFARGAIRAALWLHGRPPGRYGMDDVLGLA